MTYRAKSALPCIDHERAIAGLRADLRKLAADQGAPIDWSTLRVGGPDEVTGADGVVCYEWTGTVDGQSEPARYL
jgi:hypothetical protein